MQHYPLSVYFFFFNDTATTEIYTLHIVGSVRCVQETACSYDRGGAGTMIVKANDVLIRPLITEKTTGMMQENKYTFIVPLTVNKVQVRQAVEQVFKVKVLSVNTIRVMGKVKRMGKNSGKRSDFKKAIVKLAPGERIEFFEGVQQKDFVKKEGHSMAVKGFKPYTPGRRFMTVSDFSEITTDKSERSLVECLQKRGGRNNQGRLTVRHQGGGHKRLYRIIDFKRNKDSVPAKVATIEYDPNRSANIALLHYVDGEKKYILAPYGLKVGDTVVSGADADIKVGNALPLKNIPVGTILHNLEMKIGKGGQMLRSAGAGAQLMAKDGNYALLRMPSGELRKIHINCRATIGQVGNLEHENISIGKAGRSRWLGIRPANRGVAMNPIDHPHGGGEGRSPVGRKHPVTPWGKNARGVKTRRNKVSDKMIVKRRTKQKGGRKRCPDQQKKGLMCTKVCRKRSI
eukprot:TRINITY_DN5906_c0_g1_i1.p1 TRINITY_DN5906_c0_g1~~TRINITY_DN5906_c0_g1_i1.p1  ORF type:complete len:458 (+),score=19.85 TRINITY_DN5906_c0_g1_i1:74-1447(+)